MTQASGSQSRYFAFISYKREDESWARWLQHKLEYYRIPAAVRRDNPGVPETIRPVFKDTTDLEPGLLAKKIKSALDDSNYLIVICSPRSAQSEWVSKEVQTFIDSGRADHIIPFIVGGTPNAANPEDECFPTGLRRLKGEHELLGVNINEMGREAAAIKVVARMFGLRFDSLWQRYERARRQRRIIVTAAVALLAATAICVASYIWRQNVALDSANSTLEERNTELARAYADLSASNTALVAANDSVARAYSLLATANDSLDLTNSALAAEKHKLLRANSALYQRIIEATCRNAISALGQDDVLGALHLLNDFILPGDTINGASGIHPLIALTLRQAYDSITAGTVRRRPIGVFKAESAINDMKYSPDGRYIVFATNNGVVTVVDISRHYRIRNSWRLPFGKVKSLDIHPTLNLIAFTGQDGAACITDIDGHTVADLGKVKFPFTLRYSGDGRYLARTYGEGITVYDTSDYQPVATISRRNDLDIPGGDNLHSAVFDKSGDRLLIGHHSTMLIHNWKTGKTERPFGEYAFTDKAIYSSDYKHVLRLIGSDLHIYDAATGKEIISHKRSAGDALIAGRVLLTGLRAPVMIDIQKNDTLLAFSGDKDIRLMDFSPKAMSLAVARSGDELAVYSMAVNDPGIRSNKRMSGGVVTAPDGRHFANNVSEGIVIFDTDRPDKPKALLPVPYSNKMAFLPDSRSLLVTRNNGHIGIWDIDGKQKFEFPDTIYNMNIDALAMSPDGRYAFMAQERDLYKFDTPTGRIVARATCQSGVRSLSFNHRGDRLLSCHASRPKVRVWNPATLTGVKDYFPENFDRGNAAAYSPDDRFIALASDNKDICMLDTANGMQFTLSGHTSSVQNLCFADTGTLISIGYDGKLIIWDIAQRQPLHIYDINPGYVYSCDYIPHKGIIMAAGSRGIRILRYPSMQTILAVLRPYL